MRVVFLAPLILAGCVEPPATAVQNPIPAPAVARPAPVEPVRSQTPPKPAETTPARSETSASSPKPKPLPRSVTEAVNNPSSDSTTTDSNSSNEAETQVATGEKVEGCNEGSWWGLVGRPRSAASIVSEPKRVYTEGDSVTMDNNPDRTNIVLDAEGKIAKVTCG